MSLIDLSAIQLPGAKTLPETEADILAALDGIGYLLMPYNGLPVILAISTNKISAGACERITETRLEVMQKALREAGFKPGESVDLSALAGMADEATQEEEPASLTKSQQEAEDADLPFDEEDEEDETDPYEGEEEDEEDNPDELPFVTEQEKKERLMAASKAMRTASIFILDAEIDAVMPAVIGWGIAGRGWGLPGRGDKPAREDVAGDNFLGRGLRFALLDGLLRPTLRGLPTQAAFRPEDLFPNEAKTE